MKWLGTNRMLRWLLTSLGLSSLLTGCKSEPDHSALLSDLQQQGYFNHFTDSETEVAKQNIFKDGWNAIYGENPRFYSADSENLAEGGVADFLNELKPFLGRLNVSFTVSNNWGDHDYTVTLNGKERLIWSQAELKKETDGKPGLTWGLSTVRTFALVNEMLETADANERLYAINGGNDLAAIFLPPPLTDVICASAEFRKSDWPYIPNADDPDGWFGQSH